MNDRSIITKCKLLGIDGQRLKQCLDGQDNWGAMVHAFEYLTVLGVVCDAMLAEEKEQS
jgi:hypothetical protein